MGVTEILLQFKIIFRMLKISPKGRFESIEQFQIIENKKVGCGSFGTVKLARHKHTCRLYAVKIIDLNNMPLQSQVKLVEREIRLHFQLDHPQIIKLWDTLLQEDRIYMIMEYADNGNLFSHQNSKNSFSEPQAFKFFIQTLEGVRYLHNQNIMHRDLKPENLLLDSYHNIKICDFGWCVQDIKVKRSTFCGTYQYMAPQMLFKSAYDYRVDIWALGILLYQMLHGYAPFKGKSASQVQQGMLRRSYNFSDHLSDQVKSLISTILQFQPQKRPSIKDIFQHPWIIEMSSHINNFFDMENIVLPKEVQNKFGLIPLPSMLNSRFQPTPKHRKNNSLNFQENRNININLEINNYSIIGKRGKNNYHSQQKEKEYEFHNFKEQMSHNKTSIKKSKMEPVCKTQISQMDIYKVLQKSKSSKVLKGGKEGIVRKQQNKKKVKLRKSQMQLVDKVPIRFNTQAFQKEQWPEPKLKKSHLKHKNSTNTKSTLKLLKKD